VYELILNNSLYEKTFGIFVYILGGFMKILIDMGHPSHVHFFKYFIKNMQNKGHDIKITVKDKDLTLELLNLFKFEYLTIGSNRKNIILKFIELLKIDCSLYAFCKKYNPDVILGCASLYAAHAAFLINKPCVIFDDDEYSYRLYKPFASTICTTHTFKQNLGKKHLKFNGYKELAYLHPGYFIPDPNELEGTGINKNEDFVIMRFVGWNALHDIGKRGLEDQVKIDYVKTLEKMLTSLFLLKAHCHPNSRDTK
jgi:predicted glycosyltransferase